MYRKIGNCPGERACGKTCGKCGKLIFINSSNRLMHSLGSFDLMHKFLNNLGEIGYITGLCCRYFSVYLWAEFCQKVDTFYKTYPQMAAYNKGLQRIFVKIAQKPPPCSLTGKVSQWRRFFVYAFCFGS